MQVFDHIYSNLRLSTDFFVFNLGIIRASAGLARITGRMIPVTKPYPQPKTIFQS